MMDPLALSNEMPEMSARTPVVAGQKIFLSAVPSADRGPLSLEAFGHG